MEFARDWAKQYLTKLCQTQGLDDPAASPDGALSRVVPVGDAAAMVAAIPPVRGAEYLTEDVLVGWWAEMETHVRAGIAATAGGATAYLHTLGPQWRTVGRVMFHLAENKRDPDHPFAFLATYADHVSAGGRVGHQPLGGALQQYAGDRSALLSLLTPVSRAAEQIDWVRALVDSGDVYHPMRWGPPPGVQVPPRRAETRGGRAGRPRPGLVEADPPAPAGRQRQDRRDREEPGRRRRRAQLLRRRHPRRGPADRGRTGIPPRPPPAGWSC